MTEPRAARLALFLRAAGGRHQGTAPCLLVADWIAEETGIDPAAALRPRLQTDRGVARVLKRRGGLAALMGGLLSGLSEVDTARVGDVAAIVLRDQDGGSFVAAAIRTAHGWALSTATGVSIVSDASVLRAWQVA